MTKVDLKTELKTVITTKQLIILEDIYIFYGNTTCQWLTYCKDCKLSWHWEKTNMVGCLSEWNGTF